MDVNRRILFCDRIEIRVREVILNEFDITYPQDAHFRPNVTLKEYYIYDKQRRCKMQERTYKPDGNEHGISIGKTTFIVSSFTDTQATVTAEELIIRMLKSKVAEAAKEEKIA